MGRETTFLLAVLGVLGGAFMGVLSMKLLVSRPPAGAGPDVDPQDVVVAGQDLVEPPTLDALPPNRPRRDPFVTRSAFTEPSSEDAAAPSAVAPARPDLLEAGDRADLDPPSAPPEPASPPSTPLPIVGTHVTLAGDTWWSISERAYGDGRIYRALFAWNRRLNPQVSTTPGTRLDVPPLSRLAAAWPTLMPRD